MSESKNGIKVKNLELWTSAGALSLLAQNKFHVKVSFELAKLAKRLADLRKPIEDARMKLVEKYQKKIEKDQITIPADRVSEFKQKDGQIVIPADRVAELTIKETTTVIPAENLKAFNKEFEELMSMDCETVIENKVKIPEKIASTCDKCKHNMDKPFEVEGAVITSLLDFIEVA